MGLAAWNTLLTFLNLIGAAVEAVLVRVKLCNDELLVLICVAHSGDALSMGAIERSTLLPARQLKRALDKLDAQRLITRSRSETDRRKVLVRTTKAGRRIIDALAPVMFDLVRGIAEPLGMKSTEFMRAKLRKMVWSSAADAAIDLGRMYAGQTYDGASTTTRPAQRPPTWGLAGWLRCCQWSGHVDRLSKKDFRRLGLTAPRLQVLVALSGASEGMTANAIASASAAGLPLGVVTPTCSTLEQAGLVIALGDEGRLPLFKLTEQGKQRLTESLPIANRIADDVFQGLSDEDLVRVLSLLPKLCTSAWEAREHFATVRPLARIPSSR
jgi:DNA-binding MarR family transcriptional regulator